MRELRVQKLTQIDYQVIGLKSEAEELRYNEKKKKTELECQVLDLCPCALSKLFHTV